MARKGTAMQQTDYMMYTDNFAVHDGVQSLLIKGDPATSPAPFLSIVIPTFRRPDFLKIALDSALNQQDAGIPYEVVVVDNEPPEGTPSPTQQMMESYDAPHLLYYRNGENLGIAGNWNRCAQLARGQWVAYLHDDDILLPDFIKRLQRLLARKKDADGLMALSYELKEGSTLEEAAGKARSRLSHLYDRLSPGRLLRLRRVDSHIKIGNVYGAPTCGSAFRREALLASGGFNPQFHPSFDWFFLYRFSGQYKLYRTMERMGYYRVFVNESLSEKTKRAFVSDRVDFVNYAARSTRMGKLMRRLFENEQNQAIYHEAYSDYSGKQVEDFFTPARMAERPVRKRLYRLLTQGYWHTRNYLSLFFG